MTTIFGKQYRSVQLRRNQSKKAFLPFQIICFTIGLFGSDVGAMAAEYSDAMFALNPPTSNQAGAGIPNSGVPNTAFAPETAATRLGTNIPVDPYFNYRWKGLIVSLPGPSGTIDGGLFGLRQKIADDYGIGYFGYTINNFYDNMLHAAHSVGGQQVYIGQRPTGTSVSDLAVTVDLGRYGIPDGQIVVSGIYQSVSWNPAGPNDFGFNTLSYYQTLFNKRIEVKVGLIPQSFEFEGTFVGGNLAGGIFGTSGNLFTETGQNGQSDPTLAIDVTGHITNYIYDKVGVSRTISPSGTTREHSLNQIGLNTSVVNSGLWFINEIGYLQPAGLNQTKTWVRGGSILGESRYVELDSPSLRGNNNFEFYLLADQQFLKTSSALEEAYRGLYAGFSAEYVPPSYNRFYQYYEGRIYGLGLLPKRPHDQISLVANDTEFSNTAVSLARRAGQKAHRDTQTVTLSYSAQMYPGTFLNLGVAYTDNPSPVTYLSNTGSALNGILGLSIYF